MGKNFVPFQPPPNQTKPLPLSPFTQSRKDIGIGGGFIAFKHVVHASSPI